MKKKIKFISVLPRFVFPGPKPASKSMPDWFRTMPTVSEGIQTVKRCVPVLDAMTTGYMMTLAADIEFDGHEFIQTTVELLVTKHDPSQTERVQLPMEFLTQPYKWTNFFTLVTPKGYSTLFVHPMNRLDLPFYSFSGVVDTDKHPVPVNFPFVMRGNFKGTIPAGTPLVQAIPFKRENWSSEIETSESPKFNKASYEMHNPPFGYYKKHWWSRKLYS